MVICLERGADLHMAQRMPLPLTVSCFSKIQTGFTFLVPAHPGSPGKRAVKWVCVCVASLKVSKQSTDTTFACMMLRKLKRSPKVKVLRVAGGLSSWVADISLSVESFSQLHCVLWSNTFVHNTTQHYTATASVSAFDKLLILTVS